MKKKGKKRISIALTVAMIAGLTACGKGNGGNGNGGSSAADASLAKQYVFKAVSYTHLTLPTKA